MKTIKKLCSCIVILSILLGLIPMAAYAEGETELSLINTLSVNIEGWSKFAVSPDGEFLYTRGEYRNDYVSYIWHLNSGRNKEIKELQNESSIDDVTFSPDGKLLAVSIYDSSMQRVMLFDSKSGSLTSTLELSDQGYVGPIRFSNDGKFLIAGVRWDRVSVIDLALRKEVYSVPKKSAFDIIRTHPLRNEFAVSSSDPKELQIINTSTGEIIRSLGDTLPPGNCGIFDMNYSPDGKYFIVSIGENCGSLVYDTEKTYEQVTTLVHYGNISFSKDSALAVIGNHVYPIEDKFKTSYGIKVKNSEQQIDPKLAFLTPNGKYFITRDYSYNSKGLIVLDASSLSVRLTGIQVEPELIALGLNESQTLKIKGIYSDGTSKILDANAVKWTVKDFYMAEVKKSDLYGLANGSTELVAEYGGFEKTVPVVVSEYPSKLSATATVGQVKLTWSGVSKTKELAGYNLYRRSTDGSYGDVPLTDFPLQTTSYIDENVGSNRQFYYIVKAVFSNNRESRASNEASSASEKRIVLQVDNPIMKVNGEGKEIDPGIGTTPVVYKGRTVLPVRSLIEELGGQLAFDNNDQKLTITLNDKKIELWIGKNVAIVNGTKKTLDVAPIIINKRTMLPLRFIGENLGLQLTWDGVTQMVELIV
jgi:hypothetical protein